MQKTTCPLDCYDGCSVIYNENKLKGDSTHPITKGYLCTHLNNWFKHPKIAHPQYNNKQITHDDAFNILVNKLQATQNDKVLFYKGSGNLGIMQNVTKLFFQAHKSVIAKGSLCDGAGNAGVEMGRGANLPLSPLEVAKSDVVILWGRNPSATNSHMLKSLKNKTLIVIDPVTIPLAKKANIFLQIKPRGDIYLAALLSRIAHMEELEDKNFIESKTQGYEDFIDYISSIPIVTLMKKCGLDNLDIIGEILYAIKDKKVSILVGVGVQHYSIGNQVLQVIDSFAAMMGLFGKKGCGVGYLSNSAYGFNSPFNVSTKTDSVVNVDFSKYDLVFIQGGNPANQMPNSLLVRENLKKTPFVVYFGLYKNETSKLADLVIPASNFLEKEDLRASYGHPFIGFMPKILQQSDGISEYELTCKLMEYFGYTKLKTENEYIKEFLGDNYTQKENFYINKKCENIPYEDGFYTDNGKFQFIEEIDDDFKEDNKFFLISAKYIKSLNSQFKTDEYLHVPPSLQLKDDDIIVLSNGKKQCEYRIINDDRLRDDCFLLHSGHSNANALTFSNESDMGNSPIFGEVMVDWFKK